MKKKTGLVLGLGFVAAGWLTACAWPAGEESDLISPDETYETTGENPEDYQVEDLAALYEEEDPQVVTMYLTIGPGNEADGTDHTWTELNSYSLTDYAEMGTEPYLCEAVLQVGDETGPVEGDFGYEDRNPNATARLRGEGASSQQQKSYRIEIHQGAGTWNDQKVISLNKHASDPMRFKNSLAYSLLEDIPGALSCRTTFVHLYVKDKSEGEDGLFRDYGLYTQVEQINGRYLKNRGLDNEGQLYQAGNFDWERHEDSLKLSTDAGYQAEAFEEHLEVKGSQDHQKLLEMLDAVNGDLPVSQVVEQYFDKENLYGWMAFHSLMGNKEVLDGNYYLYSPRGLDRWYFISWDNDAVLEESYERFRDESYSRSWNTGIFTFTQAKLFERILQDETCRTELNEMVQEIAGNILTRERISEEIQTLAQVVKPYVYSLPDRNYARVTGETYDLLADQMADEVEENYQAYLASMEAPWPIHILTPRGEGNGTVLLWEEAYQHQGRPVSYTVELARDYTFADCIYSGTVEENSCTVSQLQPGRYFLRVRASDGQYTQDAYEYYRTEAGTVIYSTMCFYVHEDGTMEAVTYNEDE